MSLLDQSLLDAVKSYSQRITQPIAFVLGADTTAGQPERAATRQELVDFLRQIASTSDKITLIDDSDAALSPISFKLVQLTADGQCDTGVVFSGIPGGHEFSSLILAMLQAGGSEIKLDASIQAMIKRINQPLRFQTFVSLSCHNCPEVVQALNQFALLNANISHEMIDGGLFQELVAQKNIQGVPAVFLNDAPFANGKVDVARLLEKLQEQYPDLMRADAGESLPNQDVTIIGGGPAGVAAAIYTARKGLNVTLITDRMGGQVKDTQAIENLISVPLTNGSELANNLGLHLREYPVTIKENVTVKQLEEVSGDEANNGGFTVMLNTGEQFFSRTLIITTGAKWRKLGVPGEDENIGNGVAFCPHCDGPFFKGKDVAVVGGGNSGIEAALDLAGIVKHVTVLEFNDQLRADQVLVDKARQTDNIEILTGVATQRINAENGKVNELVYQQRSSGEDKTLPLSAVFVQIGLIPNAEVVKSLVEINQRGEIEIDEGCRTSHPRIFAAGDVTSVPFKQINIAMGEGSKAALSAFEYLTLN